MTRTRHGVCGMTVVGVALLVGVWLAPVATANSVTAYTWDVLKDNPRFYWNFNEPGATDNAADLVRRQANDELGAQGDATRSASATGNLGSAASLDGASDFFTAATMNDHQMPGAWAVEMWMKADGSLGGSRGDYLFNAVSNNPAFIYDFGAGGDNKIELFGGGGRTAGGGPSVDDNAWHHLVATFYGNGAGFGVADRVDMALDGVVITNVPRNGFSSGFALNGQLFVGAALANGANSFEGRLDEAAFYDLSGLTEAQVAARTAQIAAHYGLASQFPVTFLQYVQGATYQIDAGTPTGGGVYADPGLTKLTDGVIGSTGASPWGSGEWVGWANVDPIITFDLGRVTHVDALFLDYLVAHPVGLYAPDSLLLEFSLDGTDFVTIPSILATAFNDFDPGGAGWNRRLVVDLGMTDARYVRLTFTNDMEWTFLGEAQFVEYVPEPASLSLLGLGALALLRRRRRS